MSLCFHTKNGVQRPGLFIAPEIATARLQRLRDRQAIAPATWAELHRHYLNWNGTPDWSWLMDFSRRIPNRAHCRCVDNFREWIFASPPMWHEAFEWSVEAHNAVNNRLDKPVITVGEALKYFSVD